MYTADAVTDAGTVLPLINDSRDNFEQIYRRAKEAGVAGLSAWPLHLRGTTKQRFFRFLEVAFPSLVKPYRELYHGADVTEEYLEKIGRMKSELRKKYGLPGIEVPDSVRPDEVVKLSLF